MELFKSNLTLMKMQFERPVFTQTKLGFIIVVESLKVSTEKTDSVSVEFCNIDVWMNKH